MYELPQNEWVVILYPNTGSVRLCPTLDFARNMLSSVSQMKHIYKKPADLKERHDHHFLEKCWEMVHKTASWHLPKTATGSIEDYDKVPPDTDTENFSNLLWQFLQDVGDRVQAPTIRTERTKDHYELKLGKMTELIHNEEEFKKQYNNQARTVFEALWENNEQFLTEEDIKKIIFDLVAGRKLKTKQQPWVIFQYYRPQFIKDGFVIRGRAPKKTREE